MQTYHKKRVPKIYYKSRFPKALMNLSTAVDFNNIIGSMYLLYSFDADIFMIGI